MKIYLITLRWVQGIPPFIAFLVAIINALSSHLVKTSIRFYLNDETVDKYRFIFSDFYVGLL